MRSRRAAGGGQAAAPSARVSVAQGLLFLALLVAALAALFNRTWLQGEVFSPADLLDVFYPWTHEAPRHEPTNPSRSDEAFFHQPMMTTHWARLTGGDFPEWDPLVLGGVPAFEQGLAVGRVLSPLSLPFYVLPADVAVTVYAPLRLLCAGLLMWLYLGQANLVAPARAAGALAFALNGAFIVWLSSPMPSVALWLPLLALAVERVCHRRRPGDAALLALGIGLQFLSAYPPTSIVVLTATGIWAVGSCVTLKPAARTSQREVAAGDRPTAAVSRVSETHWTSASPLLHSLLLLAAGALGGALLGAITLWPTFAMLADSPAGARSVGTFTLPWQNLATFALPDFWGSPLTRNWWYRSDGNYPEFVTYLGVATMALAGVGSVSAIRARDVRGLLAIVVGAFALMQMYGWPPVSWAAMLPGFRQMNPHRWHVALAFATAVLAAQGLERLIASPHRRPAGRWIDAVSSTVGGLVILAAVGALAGAAMWDQLDIIRRLGMQPFERHLILVFLVVSVLTFGFIVGVALAAPRWQTLAAWLLATLVACDLVYAGYGFNPTISRDRYYTKTPALEFLQREVGDGRISPVDSSNRFPQSHVWSMYDLAALTGFDFFGDPAYQRFVATATGAAIPSSARWDYVDLGEEGGIKLRLLGLLSANLLITPPVDVATQAVGYTALGELTDGRVVAQTFAARYDGLRRIDLLPATFDRRNEGSWQIRLMTADDNTIRASWEVAVANLRNLDWLRLECPPQPSQGVRYRLEVHAQGARAGRAATLLATPKAGLERASLSIDGRDDDRSLWLRSFSTAANRFPGAPLIYAHDLNVYRNPYARPRVWFAREARELPAADHLQALTERDDPDAVVLVEHALAQPSGSRPARVLSSDVRHPDRRRFLVDAPDGGIIVFAERFDSHWRLEADERSLPLVRADAILMAAAVPAGVRQITLEYRRQDWLVALAVSGVAALGIVIALLRVE
jgi:hypothetical protein